MRPTLIAGVSATVALMLSACGGGGGKSTSVADSTPVATVSSTTSTSSTSSTTATKSRSKPAKNSAAKKSSATHTTSTHSTTSTTRSTSTTHTTRSTAAPAYVKPIRATLVGANHHPVASKPWPYTVTATDARGRPLPGTVDIQFTFNGVVVGHDTPPTHPLKNGRWHDNLKFPPQAIGQPIKLQAVIHTALGTVTLDWPVKTVK